jgi:hypothetical protein
MIEGAFPEWLKARHAPDVQGMRPDPALVWLVTEMTGQGDFVAIR